MRNREAIYLQTEISGCSIFLYWNKLSHCYFGAPTSPPPSSQPCIQSKVAHLCLKVECIATLDFAWGGMHPNNDHGFGQDLTTTFKFKALVLSPLHPLLLFLSSQTCLYFMLCSQSQHVFDMFFPLLRDIKHNPLCINFTYSTRPPKQERGWKRQAETVNKYKVLQSRIHRSATFIKRIIIKKLVNLITSPRNSKNYEALNEGTYDEQPYATPSQTHTWGSHEKLDQWKPNPTQHLPSPAFTCVLRAVSHL